MNASVMDKVSLIYKVLSGEASAAEQEELDAWVAETPENKEEFEDIKLVWASENQAEGEDATGLDDGFDRIKARMRADVSRQRWLKAVGKTTVIVVLGLAALFVLDNFEGWLPGAQNIQFEDVALEQAIGVIEDKYNIRIEVDNPELLHRHVTLALYEVGDEQHIVESLAQALNAEVTALSNKRYKLMDVGGDSNSLKLRK